MIASEVARRLDVRDSTVYSWLQGEFRPANPKRITIFFDSVPVESGSGIARQATNIASTRTGAALINRVFARFASNPRARFKG